MVPPAFDSGSASTLSASLNGQAVASKTFAGIVAPPLPPTPPVLPGVSYLGSAVNGPRTYFFYGSGNNITAGVIIDPNKQFTVTHFTNAKITVNGGFTGRMYATDEDNFQYTFVLSGMDFQPALID